MFSMLAHITWQQWRLHKLRTLLTIVGIALGVAVFFAVRTANVTLLSSLTTTIEKLAGKTTLQVIGGETGFPEEVWDVVRDTPGVKVAEPVALCGAVPRRTSCVARAGPVPFHSYSVHQRDEGS